MDTLPLNYFGKLEDRISRVEREKGPVIRLDIGSPDLPPPSAVIERLRTSASRKECHGYQSHRGTNALRQAWADHYLKHHGVELDPEREILPLIGSKEGIFHLSLTLIDQDDLVLLPDPGYQTYRMGTRFCGGITKPVSCLSGEDYFERLTCLPEDVLRQAKLMWVNFPHNPTGATANLEQFQELVALARKHDIFICHDGAYTQVTYDDYKAPSMLGTEGAKSICVEFNSLSKSHNMAGWRLGVLVGNRDVIQRLYTFKTHADSGQFLPLMEGGVAALEADRDWVEKRNAFYQSRRDQVVSKLRSMGIDVKVPRGGLYIWFPIPDKVTSEKCVEILVDRYQVALAPGTVFGSRGKGYLRLSLTSSEDQLLEGMERISRGMHDIF